MPGAWAASCWLIRSCLLVIEGVWGVDALPYYVLQLVKIVERETCEGS